MVEHTAGQGRVEAKQDDQHQVRPQDVMRNTTLQTARAKGRHEAGQHNALHPPPLTAVAVILLDNDVRSSTKAL